MLGRRGKELQYVLKRIVLFSAFVWKLQNARNAIHLIHKENRIKNTFISRRVVPKITKFIECWIISRLHWKCFVLQQNYEWSHCVKKVRIWSFYGPYSVRMRGNTDNFHAVSFEALKKICYNLQCFSTSFPYNLNVCPFLICPY